MKEVIVIKIGSSVLMTKRCKLNEFRIAHIAKQIFALQKEDIRIVLVISGSVAYGSNFIDLSKKQHRSRQAAAGIGQIYMTCIFNSIFAQSNLQLAQILLTNDSLKKEAQKKKVRNLIKLYVNSGFIPLINENDVLDLNSFGGNDHLAGVIAALIDAERLLILSTHEGSQFGIGGGKTKQEVVRLMKTRNIKTDILDGKSQDIILKTLL